MSEEGAPAGAEARGGEGGGETGGETRDPPTAPGAGTAFGPRPLVLPETFDGTGNWSDWCFHLQNVASVNGWNEAQKLQWLRVRVTG